MPQLQKAIPVAAAPFKKFLRVVIQCSPRWFKPAFPMTGRLNRRPFLISSSNRLPSRKRKRSEEHTSELQSHLNLVCRLLLEKKKKIRHHSHDAHNSTAIMRTTHSHT